MNLTSRFSGYWAPTDMIVDAPLEEEPSDAAALIPPIELGAEPSIKPIQYNDPPKTSNCNELIKFTMKVNVVLV